MDASLDNLTWPDDLAERARYCADLVDCAVLAGRIRFTVYVGKLGAIGTRLRALAVHARSVPPDGEHEDWCAHVVREARDLSIRLRVDVRLHACADEGAHEDLVLVASELAIVASEAVEMAERAKSRIRSQGGAA